MKNFIYLLGAGCIVTTCLVSIGGCSTDFEEPYSSDLTIENQITRIKRTSPELNHGEIPVRENECALYALTYLKGDEDYWKQPGRDAEEYYRRLDNYAKKNYGYEGGEMNENTILGVGEHFGLLQGKKSFSSNNNSSTLELEFLLYNVKMIGMPGHVGTMESYNADNGEVTYRDSKGSHKCSIHNITTIYY